MMGFGGYGYFYGAPLPYFLGAGFFDIVYKKEVIYYQSFLIYCFFHFFMNHSLNSFFLIY
jgi:hypothetical protein